MILAGLAADCDRLGCASGSSGAGSRARIERRSYRGHGKREETEGRTERKGEEDVGVKKCRVGSVVNVPRRRSVMFNHAHESPRALRPEMSSQMYAVTARSSSTSVGFASDAASRGSGGCRVVALAPRVLDAS